MGNSIYGNPKPPTPPPLKTAPTLQEQIIILERKKSHLEKLIEGEIQKAKQAKTKEDGIRHLKLKHMYENQMKTIFGMLDRLEGLDEARQRVALHASVIAVTQQATDAIKSHTLDASKVEDTMYDAKEAVDEVNRVSEVLGRSESPSEELQSELDALLDVPKPVIVPLPEVPVQEEPKTEMEKELRILVPS